MWHIKQRSASVVWLFQQDKGVCIRATSKEPWVCCPQDPKYSNLQRWRTDASSLDWW